jgi:tetratricopeptide (TPR) repeat protein
MVMSKYTDDTLHRLYKIGGADLALRYNDMRESKEMLRSDPESDPESDYELKITGVRFFNAGDRMPPMEECRFAQTFSQTDAHYIYYKLDMINPWKYTSHTYKITARYYSPDNTLLGERVNQVKTNPDWRTFWHSDALGWSRPGHWTPGAYRVDILVDDDLRTSGAFTIARAAKRSPLFNLDPFGFNSDLLSWPPRLRTNPLLAGLSTLNASATEPSSQAKEKAPPAGQPARKTDPPPPQGLGLDGWMERLNQAFPTRNPPGDGVPDDDLGKLRRLSDIDRRCMQAVSKARPGMDDPKIVHDLQQIVKDYQALLDAPMPRAPIYTRSSLQSKLADAHASLAQSFASRGDAPAARRHYTATIDLYQTLGEHDRVKRFQDDLARLESDRTGDVDQEIARLSEALSAVAKGSVDHADLLIELGGVYRQNGDDFEAEKLLLQAEKVLDNLGGEPLGEDKADALTHSLLSIAQGQTPEGANDIRTTIRIDGLYRLLSIGLSRVYATSDPQKAAHYRAKAAQRDSREQNDAFSKKMLGALDGLLKEL